MACSTIAGSSLSRSVISSFGASPITSASPLNNSSVSLAGRRNPELLPEGTAEFGEHPFADDDHVFGESGVKHV